MSSPEGAGDDAVAVGPAAADPNTEEPKEKGAGADAEGVAVAAEEVEVPPRPREENRPPVEKGAAAVEAAVVGAVRDEAPNTLESDVGASGADTTGATTGAAEAGAAVATPAAEGTDVAAIGAATPAVAAAALGAGFGVDTADTPGGNTKSLVNSSVASPYRLCRAAQMPTLYFLKCSSALGTFSGFSLV